MCDTPAASAYPPLRNVLAQEASLYLRQHAGNPVAWQPWRPEVLARAAAERRLVFVSVGYSSCHWCHVMEREAFDDPEVAALLNAHFVCIKIDREERPDLDTAFMTALHLMTGHGGWPLNLFMTPELLPFYGGTYFPAEHFQELLKQIIAIWHATPEKLETSGEQLRQLAAREPSTGEPAAITAEHLAAAAHDALAGEDIEHGGFKSRMKFPLPVRLSLLLRRYRRTGEPALAACLTRALDAMAQGGIRDQLSGGFHRYTVEPTWTVPHFEKMLYDNAQLALLYLDAGVVLDQPRFNAVARTTLDFMTTELFGQGAPAFHASLDADSGGHEGSYYVWTPAQLHELAGPEDGTALALVFGVTAQGNFEGANVLTRRIALATAAKQLQRTPEELNALLERWVPEMLKHRADRTAPALDPKIVTAWNGMALVACARGAAHCREPRYLDCARQAADYILQVHRLDDGGLVRASTGGQADAPGVVADYAWLALGLLELFQATFDPHYFDEACRLLDYALAHFHRPAGGFYTSADTIATPLGRQTELFDNAEPAGSAVLLRALQLAAALADRADYRAVVEAGLAQCAGLMQRAGMEMASWFELAELHAGPYCVAVVAGEPDAALTGELLRVCRSAGLGHCATLLLGMDGASPEQAQRFPSAAGKRATAGQALAYVCDAQACYPPTADPAELRTLLMRGWSV